MKAKGRVRRQPPWWLRAGLYAATWPRPEFYEYRIKMHRVYLRKLKSPTKQDARKYAVRAAFSWWWAAGYRVSTAIMRVFVSRFIGPPH